MKEIQPAREHLRLGVFCSHNQNSQFRAIASVTLTHPQVSVTIVIVIAVRMSISRYRMLSFEDSSIKPVARLTTQNLRNVAEGADGYTSNIFNLLFNLSQFAHIARREHLIL